MTRGQKWLSSWNDLPCDKRIANALCQSMTDSNIHTYIIIGVIVLLLLLVSVGIGFFIRKKQKTKLDVNEDNNVHTYDTYYDNENSNNLGMTQNNIGSYNTYYE